MKKKIWVILFLLSIILVIAKPQISCAGDLDWPDGPTGPSPLGKLGSNGNVTFVNGSGEVLDGPGIAQGNIIPIVYYGNNMKDDISGYDWTYNQGYTGMPVRINKVAYYNGEYLTLAMKIDAHYSLKLINNGKGGIIPDQSGNLYPSSTEYEIWLEDSKGNEITDENIRFALPTNLDIPIATGTQYRQYDYINNGLENTIVLNNSTSDQFALNNLSYSQTAHKFESIHTPSRKYTVEKANVFVANNNQNKILTSMNMLYRPNKGHFIIRAGVMNGTYPNGKYSDKRTDTIDSIQFFTENNKFLLPLKYNLPSVVDTSNEDTYQAKFKVTQPLFSQAKDSFYPTNGLTVKVKLPESALARGSLPGSSVTIKDKNGTDLTSQLSLTKNDAGNVSYTIPKSLLISLGNNILTLEGTVDLNKSVKNVSTYSSNGTVTLPITAQNSDNGTNVSEGTAQVKIPTPTADPVPQKVYVGTKSSELDAAEFVKNVTSILSDDSLKVFFKEQKTFSVVKEDTILVEIQSELTGAKSELTVPVTVLEKPKESANLVWQPSSTGLKDKTEKVDKSTMSSTLEQKIAWWTIVPDRNYIISVRDVSGTEITSNELETNGSKVNTKIDVSFDMPTAKLKYGSNSYTVGIYVKDGTGKATGSPLDSINLTINMDGSLQLVSVPSELKWTNRLSSKGLMSRDTGNEMIVKVIDTRNIPDVNKSWSVSAQAISVSGESVPFELRWCKDDSSPTESLNEKQNVLTKSETVQSNDVYTKKWDEQTGILLFSDDYLKVNDYSNKVKVVWNLYDTETIE